MLRVLICILAIGLAVAPALAADAPNGPAINMEELLPQSENPAGRSMTDQGPSLGSPQPRNTPANNPTARNDKPETKPEVKPEAKPEVKPETKPETGKREQQQSETARQRQEMDDWLSGCWVAVKTDASNHSQRTYCFNRNGSGTLTTVPYCQGSFRYTIDNSGNMVIKVAKQTDCPYNGYIVPSTINCRRTGDTLDCRGVNHDNNPRYPNWQAQLKRK